RHAGSGADRSSHRRTGRCPRAVRHEHRRRDQPGLRRLPPRQVRRASVRGNRRILPAANPAYAGSIPNQLPGDDIMAFKYNRLDKDDVALLMVDHQAGLLSLVRDFSPDDFRNNVLALAEIAKFFDIPTILTTSLEDGPNGPMVPELKAIFPDAPYFARPGQINAWDNDDF